MMMAVILLNNNDNNSTNCSQNNLLSALKYVYPVVDLIEPIVKREQKWHCSSSANRCLKKAR